MRLRLLVVLVCGAFLSACSESEKPDRDDAADETTISPLTETLDEAARVEGIIDEQKRRTDALLDEAEGGDQRPQR